MIGQEMRRREFMEAAEGLLSLNMLRSLKLGSLFSTIEAFSPQIDVIRWPLGLDC
jgi:hypothetical protein